MDPSQNSIPISGQGKAGSSGPVSKSLQDIFDYGNSLEQPPWLSAKYDSGHEHDEDKLLDNLPPAILRTWSIDSSHSYSRTGSLDSQQSDDGNDELVLRVPMCCESCERKAKSLDQLEGVTSVVCDFRMEKVMVTGTAHHRIVLEACKKLFQQSEIWTELPGLSDVPESPTGSTGNP